MKWKRIFVQAAAMLAALGFTTMLASTLLAEDGVITRRAMHIMATAGLYAMAGFGTLAILVGRPWDDDRW